jgi:hypothetical protein
MSAVKKSRLFEQAHTLKKYTLPASSLILVRPGGLIFFVTFLHQGKKVKALYSKGKSKRLKDYFFSNPSIL